MRKGTYNIEVVKKEGRKKIKKLKQINGYIVEYDGVKYGIDKRWSNSWVVTELRSGYSVGNQLPKLKDFWTEIPKWSEKVKSVISTIPQTNYINDVDKL